MQKLDFSFRSREQSLVDFESEQFDLLIIGGGITGAATARDAVSRGLKVALVEKNDFAWGTSSRSSKLIHGGLRYLENFEFGLVFEALSERAFLLKSMPELVRPLPFYMPVYEGDAHGRGILSLGLWLYDLLALFRTPKFHQSLSQKKILEALPGLSEKGLKGGFQYYDASMWDDALVIETLRSAKRQGVTVANYVEAVSPIWKDDRIVGYRLKDQNPLLESSQRKEITLKASQTIVCAGPWTDLVGSNISDQWKPWLNTSKGIHLVFDLERIPIPGAILMSHPSDGRIAFVIPRPDYGKGVVIVGTTDGATDPNPEKAEVSQSEVDYLLDLLARYFPDHQITEKDIISAYVGVRPLMGSTQAGSEGQKTSKQKISREHYISEINGGAVFVAGGKYTTHRKMALEIVDYTLDVWKKKAKKGLASPLPPHIRKSQTKVPLLKKADHLKLSQLPESLLKRYGSEAEWILEIQSQHLPQDQEIDGFPWLESQLRYEIRTGMVLRLEDFYIRRTALSLARKDQGIEFAEKLSLIWAEELGLTEKEAQSEVISLRQALASRQAWRKKPSMHKEESKTHKLSH